MLATCICLNGSLLDQLSCTIVYLHNLFTCTFGRINMSVCLSVCHLVSSELRKHCALYSCLGDFKAVGSLYWIFEQVYAFVL